MRLLIVCGVLATSCLLSGCGLLAKAPLVAAVLPELFKNRGGPEAPDASLGYAQDFEFTAFNGATHRLSDFAGQPVVLNFWADW